MSKLRGICFGILLIALAVGVSGCFGSSTLISDNGIPMVPNRTMINAELPYVPKALTGEDVGGKTVKSLPLPTDNDGWGNFEVVPQIGVNYNGWVDSLKNQLASCLISVLRILLSPIVGMSGPLLTNSHRTLNTMSSLLLHCRLQGR